MAGTINYASHGVGGGHAQVVVAMGAEYGFASAQSINVFHQVFNFVAIFKWYSEACGVGDVNHCSTGFHHGFYYASQILVVGAASILSIEFNVVNISLGVFYGSNGTFNNLLAGGVEFVFYVAVACANSRVNAFAFGVFQRFRSNIDIAWRILRQQRHVQ